MNQILLTNNESNEKSNKSNKYKNNNAGDMKKIIVFFGIAILIFGLVLMGIYGYKLLNKNNGDEKTISKPELSLEETENEVTIVAKSTIGINKIIYTWNDENSQEVEMNGRTSHEEKINIPDGENTLKVKVIDQNGQEIETTKSFSHVGDGEKPIIETAIIENAKLKITATDEIAMQYITYKWNDEADVKVEVENEGNTKIETTIDVKRGKNTLTVTAVNSSDNTETVNKIFNGVNDPIIEVIKNGNRINMKISHDMGFEKIEFILNETTYVYDDNFSGYDSTKEEIEYSFGLKEGENTVIITATSMEGTEATYKGKCNYSAE